MRGNLELKLPTQSLPIELWEISTSFITGTRGSPRTGTRGSPRENFNFNFKTNFDVALPLSLPIKIRFDIRLK